LSAQTLYDYEVAVYAELNNGSNAWNGSVLAVMLLAGTIGALLPTWLKHDVDTEHKAGSNKTSAPGKQATNLDSSSDVPTGAQDSSHLLSDNYITADVEQPPRVYKATSEFVVGMRITVAGVLSCVSLLLFVLSWQVVASVSFLALFFATWQYINVVCFARLALALKLAQLEQRHAHMRDMTESTDGEAAENNKLQRSNKEFIARTIVPMDRTLSTNHEKTHGITTSTGAAETQAHLLHSLYPVVTSRGAKTQNSAGSEQQIGSAEDIPEPPYSVALVSVIALNVVVQIILQAVTFSGLALPLRASCWVFVLTFCAATAAYVLCMLCYFGQAAVGTGLRGLFVRD
jgi:hypothetical protein